MRRCAGDAQQFRKSLSPMGEMSAVADIVDAIVYLEARHGSVRRRRRRTFPEASLSVHTDI